MTCSTMKASPLTTSVIRDTEGSSVSPTDKLSILYPRAENSPATRDSTPNLFSTITAIVCFSGRPYPSPLVSFPVALSATSHSLQLALAMPLAAFERGLRPRLRRGRAWEGAVEAPSH